MTDGARGAFLRFLVAGGINTAFSMVAYWFLLPLLHYLLAYSAAYGLGVIISYFLNALYVFRKRARLMDFVRFPTVYVVQYCLAGSILWVLVHFNLASRETGMLVAVAVTVPVTFLLTRMLLHVRVK